MAGQSEKRDAKDAVPRRVKRFGEAPQSLQRQRLALMRLVFFGVFAAIAFRLAFLQFLPAQQLAEEDLRHVGNAKIQPPRGTIFDRAERPLAIDANVPSLCVNPQRVQNPSKLAADIADRLGMDRAEVLDKITRKGTQFVFVKRWMTREEEAKLGDIASWAAADVKAKGVWLADEPVRSFPENDLAAHVIGYVNREHVGAGGLEGKFDKYLKATPGTRTARKDGYGRLIASLTLSQEDPEGGSHLYTTLDSVIQQELEDALDARMAETNARRAMGVMMDPKTGAILALASRPAFDPNAYWDYDMELLKNHAVTDVFEPGSVFKIVTAAAVLEHDLVTTETLFDCEGGTMRIGRRSIRDYHKLGVEPFSVCFAESSNIALIKAAAMLGEERLEKWIRAFGFGAATAPEITGESKGIFRPRSQWSGYSMGSLPMGQEVSVTMLQLAKAFAIIANGGYVVEPYIIERIVDRDGHAEYERDRMPGERILSPETAQTMRELCHLVVTNGTGSAANIDDYRVGGKTGTAQMAKASGGGYEANKYTTVFAGFAPLNDPRVVTVIVVQEPQIKLAYGGYVCGPVFKDVTEKALRYLHVPKDPVVTGTMLASAAPEAAFDADLPVFDFDSALMDSLLDDELIDPMADVLAVPAAPPAAAAGPVLPDLRGMTKREALAKLNALGVRWDMQGSGWLASQEPAAGTRVADVEVCRLVFTTREAANDDMEPGSDGGASGA